MLFCVETGNKLPYYAPLCVQLRNSELIVFILRQRRIAISTLYCLQPQTSLQIVSETDGQHGLNVRWMTPPTPALPDVAPLSELICPVSERSVRPSVNTWLGESDKKRGAVRIDRSGKPSLPSPREGTTRPHQCWEN